MWSGEFIDINRQFSYSQKKSVFLPRAADGSETTVYMYLVTSVIKSSLITVSDMCSMF
jgi:hypothetical protein